MKQKKTIKKTSNAMKCYFVYVLTETLIAKNNIQTTSTDVESNDSDNDMACIYETGEDYGHTDPRKREN